MRRSTWLLAFVLFSTQTWGEENVSGQQFAKIGDLALVSGKTLHDVRVGFITAGTLNDDRSNVIVFPSWFTGSAEALFQAGKIGPGKLADTDRYFVIVIDSLANGVSASPSNSSKQGGAQFPAIEIDDMVRANHTLVTQELGFDHVNTVMGISMGGMQVFQWIGQYPGFMDKAVAIDGSPRMNTYDLAQWQAHEQAIESLRAAGASDETAMKLVLSMTLLTLWTPDYFVENVPLESWGEFRAGFMQGAAQANADDYLAQLRAMIKHDVFADHPETERSYEESVQADLLVVGVSSDHMVNPAPGRNLAASMGLQYLAIESACGHVGSSCQEAEVVAAVHRFLDSQSDEPSTQEQEN